MAQYDLKVYTRNGRVVAKEDADDKGPMTAVEALKLYNPDTDAILCYTNKRVLELNDIAAAQLGLQGPLVVGDDIIFGALDGKMTTNSIGSDKIYPGCVIKGQLEPGKSAKIEKDIMKYGTTIDWPTTFIEHNDETYEIYFDLDHYANSKLLEVAVNNAQAKVYKNNDIPDDIALAKWCGMNRNAAGVRERAKAWTAYLTHSNLVFDVRRPYAKTVHKMQGSEVLTVFLDQNDIKKSIRNGYYETYSRLMYVALSRAIKEVVIIS